MLAISIFVAIALLVAANALYVAAEFGAVSASVPRLRAMAADGHPGARRLLPVVERPDSLDRHIAACQVGITVSSLVLGSYGQAQIAPHLAGALESLGPGQWAAAHSVASLVILIGLTVFQMVLGELVPKGVALQYPDRTALATARPLEWSTRILAPLIWIFNGSAMVLLRLLGLRQASHRHVHSQGEIDLLLSAESSDAELDSASRRRLRRALRLGSRRARDLMVPRHRIATISLDTRLDDAVSFATDEPYTRFPAHHGDIDRIAGVLHTKDLVKVQMSGESPELSSLLRPVVEVPLDAGADDILVALREQRAGHAIVVDASGRTAGLVTLGDVLADVFGKLADEFKSGPRERDAR